MTNLEERASLEERVGNERISNATVASFGGIVHRYLVDTTAGWLFYTPLMVISEYGIAGMSGEEVLQSRLYAAAVHAVIMRPYGKYREWWATTWKADAHSTPLKKAVVDTTASILFQLPLYSGILYASGASWKEIAVALPAGLAIGTISGRPFGYALDKWRKMWGAKPTLET